MMRKLLLKDWRVNRAAVVGGAALAACPYAVVFALQAMYPPGGGHTFRTVGGAVEQASSGGLLLTLITAAVFGGIAFAAERRDRSAEFIAMLPAARSSVVLSKLLVAVPCLVVPGLVHLCVGFVGTSWRVQTELPPFFAENFLSALLVFACMATLLFGVAWTLSVFIESPAIAASVAMGVGVLLYLTVAVWVSEYAAERPHLRLNPNVWAGFAGVAVGAVAFAASTAHYLRRVRP